MEAPGPAFWKIRIVSSAVSFASAEYPALFHSLRAGCGPASGRSCRFSPAAYAGGLRFLFVIFDFAAFFFNCNAALFQIGNNVFKADVLFVDLLFGGLDDFVGKTELFGNCKGVTFSGNADQQPVGRAQRFHIEFTAGVFNKSS